MLFGSKDKKIEHAIEKKNPAGVIGFFEDKDENIRLMAIDAAGKIGGDDCMNALIPLLHNSDARVRAAAATALGAVGNSHAAAFLSYQLDHEQDPTVQAAVRKAMQVFHGEE